MRETRISAPPRHDRALAGAGRLLVLLLAAALPLIVVPDGGTGDPDVLPKVLAARAAVIVLGLLWVARIALAGSVRLRRTPLDLSLLALVASAALSTVLSVNPWLSVFGGYTRYEGLLTLLTYAALYWLAAQLLRGPDDARLLLRALLAGAAVECAIACAQALSASTSGDLGVFGESATTFGGVARAAGTMANANNLAIFAAMLIPVGLGESLARGAAWWRLLAGLATALLLVTLVITFGRGAWVGAGFGVLAFAALSLRARRPGRTALTAAAAVVAAATLLLAGGALADRAGVPVAGAAYERLLSIARPSAGSGGVRLHLYADSLHIVAERPLVGFGPDTFGLVYPSRSSGDWTPGVVVDKAHSDLLQVAVSQGVLGAAAYVWLVAAVAVMLVGARRRPGVPAAAGGALAYAVAITLNFAWFPVTAPFFVLLACGAALSQTERAIRVDAGEVQVAAGGGHASARECEGVRASATMAQQRSLELRSSERETHATHRQAMLRGGGFARAAAGVFALATAVAAIVLLVVRPALADRHYAQALAAWDAGNRAAALQAIALARDDNSAESVYAAFQGDLEGDLHGDRPGPDADLAAARRAYEQAIADGTIYPSVPIRLAYVDVALGDRAGALAAARAASALDPYGPAVKLIAELGG